MPLPIINDVYRIALNCGPNAGISSVNVFHVASSPDSESDLADNINACSHELVMFQGVPPSSGPTTMTITALDGLSASQTFPVEADSMTSETSNDAEVMAEASAVVKLNTALRGKSYQGRLFLGPIAEATQENGFIVGDAVTDLPIAWQQFGANLFSADATQLVVASYKLETATPVQSISLNPGVCIQRRRLLRTRP